MRSRWEPGSHIAWPRRAPTAAIRTAITPPMTWPEAIHSWNHWSPVTAITPSHTAGSEHIRDDLVLLYPVSQNAQVEEL